MPDIQPSRDGVLTPPFLNGGGEMGALMRAHDWATTPLGPPSAWPAALQTLVAVMLGSREAMFVAWGPERVMLYNDTYAVLCGARHPAALGQTFSKVWYDIMDEVGPILDRAFADEGTHMDDIGFTLHRNGYPEEAHFSFSCTPVRDGGHEVVGIFCACTEITQKAFDDRRRSFLLALEDRLRDLTDPREVMAAASEMLGLQLSASSTGYAEMGSNGEWAHIARDWTAPGARSVVGLHRLTDYGAAFIGELRAGRTVRVDDVTTNPLTAASAPAFLARGVASFLVAPLIKAGGFAATLFVHAAAPRRWTLAEQRLLGDVAERTWAAVERARMEVELRESEERLRLIVEGARDYAIFLTDAEGRIDAWLPGAAAVFGWTAEEATGRTVHFLYTPEDVASRVPEEEFGKARKDDTAPDIRWHSRKDGSRIFIDGKVVALRDANDVVRRFLKIGQDVTARKAAEERQTLLAREVDHRAKNALAIVQTMLRLTRAEDVQAFARAVEGRVAALARAQTLLAEERWDGADLRALLGGELAPFLGEARVELDGPALILPPAAAQAVAMAVHELATNATKHGALSAAGGRVDVAWRVIEVGWQPTLELCWREEGGPPIAGPPERRGFGARVLEGTVRQQLGGTVTLHWQPSGLICEMRVPLRRRAASPDP